MKKLDGSGYDAAQTTRESDDLGRWRFAAEIAEAIRATPPDWSARIGIFGKWGEGKSTVLHFLEGILKPGGNISFYFNPWAVQNVDEMWAEFGCSLLQTLKDVDLNEESSLKEAARWFQETLDSTGLGDLGEGAAEFFGKGKLYKSAFGIVGKWLKPDGPQVRKIREKLGERRVVVFIDDLDRANPELLPTLLLSLREILDLPKFTFVLSFDNEIVASGLVNVNKAWGEGGSFLDKILDFQYHLPPISAKGKRLLVLKMLDRYCKFVPKESLEPVEHLLPDNPRKLKMLIRNLISLQPQIQRHGADELNWVEIWLAEMIRQESYPFFVHLLEGDKLDELIGIGYKLRKSEARKKGGEDAEGEDPDIKKLLDEVGNIGVDQKARLMKLVNATRELAGFHLAYSWKFALRPEALTWKEFGEFVSQWGKFPTAETISTWIIEHSKAVSIDRDDVEDDLFRSLLNAKHNAASKAAEAVTAEENEMHCVEAEQLLKITGQYLALPSMFSAERFGALYEKSLYWTAFRRNQSDARLRTAERDLIYALVDREAPTQAAALLQTFEALESMGLLQP